VIGKHRDNNNTLYLNEKNIKLTTIKLTKIVIFISQKNSKNANKTIKNTCFIKNHKT